MRVSAQFGGIGPSWKLWIFPTRLRTMHEEPDIYVAPEDFMELFSGIFCVRMLYEVLTWSKLLCSGGCGGKCC